MNFKPQFQSLRAPNNFSQQFRKIRAKQLLRRAREYCDKTFDIDIEIFFAMLSLALESSFPLRHRNNFSLKCNSVSKMNFMKCFRVRKCQHHTTHLRSRRSMRFGFSCVTCTTFLLSLYECQPGMHIGNLRMSSEEQTNKLLESGEIGRDSGFLSGACTTESDLSQTSACDLGASASCSSTSYHRLDSGVDVSDHLSQLNISEETKTITVLPHKLGDPSELPPWEYFFAPDQDGDTQLHIGVMEGYVEEVFTLIALVPHPSILDFQNDLCQTALHVAVLSKHPRIARRLVAAGARVDMRDRNGNTPLHLACQIGEIGCVQALTMALSAVETQQCQLRYAAFAQTLPQQLDLLNYDGQAPIHLAAMGGHCDVIRALHWLGTDLNATDGKGGRTALHYTVERGHIGALRCLVSECGCNLEIETYGGLTAYQMASETNNSQISQELLRMGAVPHPNRMDESDSDSDVP